MFNKMTVRDIEVKDKRVLVRCDFNVPLKEGRITDETRIVGAMPTIEYLIDQGARVILCSHMGKPKGEFVAALSLAPVAGRLGDLLGKPVHFVSSAAVVDDEVKSQAMALESGEVMLLENTRFRPEETQNGEGFSKELASLAEIFVNDAFGTAHRAHASTVGVTAFLKPAVSGFLIEKELAFLGKAVEEPQRPFVAVLGGAKVSDKIKVIDNLLSKVDGLLIGGAMAYTFLKAQGIAVGSSMVEEDKLEYAREMIDKAKKSGVELLLPIDHRVARSFEDVPAIFTQDANIPEGHMGLDIGEMTIGFYQEALLNARTVLWNGPMGVFEFENFNKGTLAIAETLAMSSATTIIGGGDSAAAVTQLGFADRLTHISTGGGASLEFLEGRVLPGIEALDDLKEEKQ